jgi:hypothetical protein
MGILDELTALVTGLGVPVETGVFSEKAPAEYVVLTPLADDFPLFGSDRPDCETQHVRLSLFSRGNYILRARQLAKALLAAGFTITARQYLGRDDDTGYFSAALDACKIYEWE